MAVLHSGCHECGSDCINVQFCAEGASYDTGQDNGTSLPKHLNIKIVANPDFWGFGDLETNVLISGWANFNNGYYDFFDGYEELHFKTKTCGATTTGPFKNEQRPDVLFRSVYDPEDPTSGQDGKKHYDSLGTLDNVERGGAEVYLVDREAGQVSAVTADNASCDDTDPTQIFKKFPENYGFGNKILFQDSIYKNITGAWRLIDVDTYNVNDIYESSGLATECDNTAKQYISNDPKRGSQYDPFRFRASGDYPNCIPDGSTAGNYAGAVKEIKREVSSSNFIQATLDYNGVAASGLKNGTTIGLKNDVDSSYDGTYTLFEVTHNANDTSVKFVGTHGDVDFTVAINSSGDWVAYNTYDAQTCCSNSAYGVDDTLKCLENDKGYHYDFGRVFNNSKNKRQSGRFPENRYTYDLDSISPVVDTGVARYDTTYPSLTSDGKYSGVFGKDLSYSGPFYETDIFDYATRRSESQNVGISRNATCYTKRSSLEVFPDCLTQYASYQECVTNATKYTIQRVPRLCFVYRGNDFYDPCQFDASGKPLSGWTSGIPSGIEDLRNGLGGLEMHMYINLSVARGAEWKRDPCGCGGGAPPGEDPPEFIEVPSPVTFPNFPKYDLNPSGYGCQDYFWQLEHIDQCESGITEFCSLPVSQHACNVRQPYTTYGYIRSLCGDQTDDRRSVITNAFSNLIQNGTYRNTSGTPIQEPMYWEFANPVEHESGITGGFNASGNYPYWGLADSTGRLVSPYFRAFATSGNTKCSDPVDYLGFDLCATRASGWPTDHVPFLIEIDHSDACINCVSPRMDSGNLTITLGGLNAEYSHAPDNGEKYGWNHCRYTGKSFDPTYTCNDGWNFPCTGLLYSANDVLIAREPYTGSTCGCIDGETHTLHSVQITGTDITVGWRTWNQNNSFVQLQSCKDDGDVGWFREDYTHCDYGHKIYASFRLACNGLHQYLNSYEDAPRSKDLITYYGNESISVLNALYDGGSCSRHYPSANSDLQLESNFVIVGNNHTEIFELIPEVDLFDLNMGTFNDLAFFSDVEHAADQLFHTYVFGCTSSKFEYGCSGVDGYGASSFYPCSTCVSGVSEVVNICDCSGVECDVCGSFVDCTGVPIEYRNPCKCECTLALMRRYDLDTSGNTILAVDNVPSGCTPQVVAVSYSGEKFSTSIIHLGEEFFSNPQRFGDGPVSASVNTTCSWSKGVNSKATGVQYEFEIPSYLSQGNLTCSTLTPENCDVSCTGDSNFDRATCGQPIPWSGSPPNGGLDVRKRMCYPEVMIVNKIDCLEDNTFKLYVSREYHSHNRNWQHIVSQGGQGKCVPKQIGAWNSGNIVCHEIDFATPSDSVTPAYYTESIDVGGDVSLSGERGVCQTHPASGTFANQDFLLGGGSGEPSVSGDVLWNYFNLFYSGGFPSSFYKPAIDLGDQTNPASSPVCTGVGTIYESGTIFPTGSYIIPSGRFGMDLMNRQHSCIQDYTQCGSEFFCNKMFFPRRNYAVNTKVSRFGSLQLCTSNARTRSGDWYTGYQDFNGRPDILKEAENTPFIDVCDDNNIALLTSGVGIDDVTIIVDDYLPLMGINSANWRNPEFDKSSSCILKEQQECTWLPLHSDPSIQAGVHKFKTFLNDGKTSFGYYMDKLTTNASDNCLFNPFKILVDVECCNSNVRLRSQPYDDPTMLEYVVEGVPSWACNGFIDGFPCGCDATSCGGSVYGDRQNAPESECIELIEVRSLYSDVLSSGDIKVSGELGDCSVLCGVTETQLAVEVAGGTAVAIFGNPNQLSITQEYGTDPTIPVGYWCDGCSDGAVTPYSEPLGAYYVAECSGDHVIATTGVIQRAAYRCGDYYYIPYIDTTLDECCLTSTVCRVLGTSWKVPVNGCRILRPNDVADHTDDFVNCGCEEDKSYSSCQDSVISATITE